MFKPIHKFVCVLKINESLKVILEKVDKKSESLKWFPIQKKQENKEQLTLDLTSWPSGQQLDGSLLLLSN